MRELLKPGGRLLYSDLYRAGAPQETEALLRAAGFGVRCFEDHARALKECAAQLVWRGGLETAGCEALRGLSYGLWVAEKE